MSMLLGSLDEVGYTDLYNLFVQYNFFVLSLLPIYLL